MTTIRNIYCVGRNYAQHAAELGNAVPEKPMIFLKPTHSIVEMNGNQVELPGDVGEIHFEGELVVHISRDHQNGKDAELSIDGIALGIDFTLRDVQSELKKKGYPWLAAKGFKQSAAITKFIPFPGLEALNKKDFTVLKNGTEVQRGNSRNMIFSIQEIMDYISDYYGLGEGDIIYTGTPAGVGRISDQDDFQLWWNDQMLGHSKAKII